MRDLVCDRRQCSLGGSAFGLVSEHQVVGPKRDEPRIFHRTDREFRHGQEIQLAIGIVDAEVLLQSSYKFWRLSPHETDFVSATFRRVYKARYGHPLQRCPIEGADRVGNQVTRCRFGAHEFNTLPTVLDTLRRHRRVANHRVSFGRNNGELIRDLEAGLIK